MVAIILEAHLAAVVEDRLSGEVLKESFQHNYDLGIDFPDRNSLKFLERFNMGIFPSSLQPNLLNEHPLPNSRSFRLRYKSRKCYF